MIKLKTLLKESMVWERKFGEPLPTLDSVMEKHQQKAKEEQINEKRYDDYLSNQAGIDVWRDRKLFLIAKNLNYSTKDLMKTAQKKDGKSYKDVLDRISVGIGVLKGYLNIKR